MGVYIKGMEMPTEGYIDVRIKCNGTASFAIADNPYFKAAEAIPVPEHGRLLNVLKTERECVSRDCDRNCGKCELSLEQSEILSAYDTLISILSDPAEEGE